MSLSTEQLKALDQLIQQGLDQSEPTRRAWFDALAIDADQRLRLERALFPKRTVESRTFLGDLPRVDDGSQQRAALVAGQRVGSYTLDRPLGEGGSASVWAAHRSDGTMKRDVALKLPYFVGNAEGWYDRVNRERDILASLQHANIATIYDAGVEANGRPWLALELIDGLPIDRYCNINALTIEARVRLVLALARAVEYAHARGVIHRDLKPGNILIDQTGQPKLLDFGIAKLLDTNDGTLQSGDPTMLTRLHGRPLTPEYASPEQRRGEAITTGVDIYALAIVLHELIAGVRPACSENGEIRVDLRAAAKAKFGAAAIGTPGNDLNAIVQKAVHTEANKRYGTISAFADDLERYLHNQPVLAQPDSGWYRFTRLVRRNRLAVGATIAVALSLVGGTGVALWQAREANAQRIAAQNEAQRANATRSFLLTLFDPGLNDATSAQLKRNQSVESLLIDAAKKLDTEFADQPKAKAEMLESIGTLHFELQLLSSARSLAEKRVALLQSNQASATEIALAKLNYANVLASQGKSTESIRELNSILALLKDVKDTEADRARATAQLYLANQKVLAGNFKDAVAEAGVAADVLERVAPNERAHLQAITLQAYGLLASGKVTESIGFYEQAIERHTRSKSPSGHFEALLRTQLSEAYLVGQKYDAALTQAKKSVEVARATAGEESYVGGRTAYWAGKVLVGFGRLDEGIALLNSAHTAFGKIENDPDPQQLMVTRAFLVEALIARGQLRDAQLVARLLEDTVKKFESKEQLTLARRISEVWLSHMDRVTGRTDDAARRLSKVVDGFASSFPPRSEPMLAYQARLAGIYLDAGNADQAFEHLKKFEPPPTGANGKLTRAGIQLMTARIRAQAGLGDRDAFETATRFLSRVEAEIDATERELRVFEIASVHRTLAEAAITAKRFDIAARQARLVIAIIDKRVSDDAPQLAADRALLAFALASIDRPNKEARELASLAESALAREASAGPQFRTFLARYKRLVGSA
jgi:eukaryotic-like serine/threonine-protein kinase